MRLAIGIEYDGCNYNGWQRQRVGSGVQAEVERALSEVANEAIDVVCAGRTDTGVHATGQVAHFDTVAERRNRSWLLGANSTLPDDVNLRWVVPVSDEFHARFSATARHYRYRILNRLVRSAIDRNRCWWLHAMLDHDRMHAAGQQLIGEHDFSAFRGTGCQANTASRELTALSVSRDGDWITVTVSANAFLKHMVRNIVGTLVAVGLGERPEAWVAEVLQSRDRRAAGVTAPPQGLTLEHVDYPPKFDLPVGRLYRSDI